MSEPTAIRTDETPALGAARKLSSRSSFADLYAGEYRRTVGLAALLVDGVDTAEEITQDAFVALHRNWAEVIDPIAYLRRSVVNGGRDVQRRRAVRRRHPVPTSDRSEGIDVNHLDDVLATLPPKQRAAIVLRYCEDMS